MQRYQYIRMCLRQYIIGGFVGKFRIGMVLGLLFFVATLLVNVPGASAQTHKSCSASDRTYTVMGGDTLSSIGSRLGVNWSSLASYNHIANSKLVSIGQTLCIPTRGAVSTAPVQGQQSAVPLVASTSKDSIVAMIYQTFGAYGSSAVAVATCESGLNPNAYNSSGAAGLFQIMPGTWAGTSEAGQSPFNASANTAAAHEIFVRDGYSWREWTCKP